MLKRLQKRLSAQQMRQATFFLTFALIMLCSALPQNWADALYSVAGDAGAEALERTPDFSSDKIIVIGADGAETTLAHGEKVTVTHGEEVQYATTRSGETLSALLARMELSVSELEMVIADVSGEEVQVEVASSFTYYETLTEEAAHTTLYTLKHDLPKGETKVIQQGIDGTRDVTYEVIYADGQLVSRQAVEERSNTSVTELAYLGTLVKEVAAGDTILKNVPSGDGSGYLKMASGDSLHYTGAMSVTCTAYTDGYGGADQVTATGTNVRVGCVAVDKRVIPLGTKMFVTAKNYTYGMATAEDTGVRGSKVDLYLPSYNECMSFGRRSGTVYILD